MTNDDSQGGAFSGIGSEAQLQGAQPGAPDWSALAKGGTMFVTPRPIEPAPAPAAAPSEEQGPAGLTAQVVADEAELGVAIDPMIGRVIEGRYRILDKIGEGGMGSVYRAEHLKLNKQVAVKLIRAETLNHDEVLARFEREAKVTALLDHPHIVGAMDYGELLEGGAFLVSTLVHGQSLEAILARGPLPWGLACRLGGQIADALAMAHGLGIIHRDLKPDNLIIERQADGSAFARVLDFGLARITENSPVADDGAVLTRVGVVLGTPGYMAPEQAIGGVVDARADLYSLGVLLWECISGRRLWPADDLESLVEMQLTQEAPSLSGVEGVELPAELVELVERLLARNASARARDAVEVCTRLNALADGAPKELSVAAGVVFPAGPPSGAREPVAVTQIAESPTAAAERLLSASRSPNSPLGILAGARGELRSRAPGRNLAIVAGAALLLVALVGGLVVALTGSSDDGASSRDDEDVEEPAAATAKVSKRAGAGSRGASAPAELEEPIAVVIDGKRPNRLKRSIETILEHEPADEVPDYARLAAAIERASTCKEKQPVLLELEQLGDPRVLPLLRRMSKLPRDECGKAFKRRDCLGCLRKDLRRAIVALRAVEAGA